MSKSKENPCGSCKLAFMEYSGCCTEDVGFGTRTVRLKNGKKYEVCKNLEKVPDGPWVCAIYRRRPPVCSNFRCERFDGEFY